MPAKYTLHFTSERYFELLLYCTKSMRPRDCYLVTSDLAKDVSMLIGKNYINLKCKEVESNQFQNKNKIAHIDTEGACDLFHYCKVSCFKCPLKRCHILYL